MKQIFSEKDFSIEDLMHHPTVEIMFKHFADKCNKKINELIKSWPVVLGQIKNIDGGLTDKKYWCATQISNNGETHTARLAFIEEIKRECVNHIPKIQSNQVIPPMAKDPYGAA